MCFTDFLNRLRYVVENAGFRVQIISLENTVCEAGSTSVYINTHGSRTDFKYITSNSCAVVQ